jgi:hypothetical protein
MTNSRIEFLADSIVKLVITVLMNRNAQIRMAFDKVSEEDKIILFSKLKMSVQKLIQETLLEL